MAFRAFHPGKRTRSRQRREGANGGGPALPNKQRGHAPCPEVTDLKQTGSFVDLATVCLGSVESGRCSGETHPCQRGEAESEVEGLRRAGLGDRGEGQVADGIPDLVKAGSSWR